MSKVYVHYGSSNFNRDRMSVINDEFVTIALTKPPAGLWGSAIDARFGWKDWCKSECFHEESLRKKFSFSLKGNARILEVHSEDDVASYLQSGSMHGLINWDLVMKKYDGLELFLSDDCSMRSGVFRFWDCDSIVVWNSEIIEEIK